MSLRMRKSVKLGPGLRLTASHRGASLRVGGRGFGYSASTTGRRTMSGGIPGSGVSFPALARRWSADTHPAKPRFPDADRPSP